MNLTSMQAFTDNIVEAWGMRPITVKVNTRLRSSAGRANYSRRTIEIAGWMQNESEANIKDTLIHEIAHIFTGIGIGIADHGPEWQQWAITLGGSGSATYSPQVLTNNKIESVRVYFTCPDGCEIRGQRRPRRDYSRTGFMCRKHLNRWYRTDA